MQDAGTRLHVLQVIGNAIVGGMESWVERLIERLPGDAFRFTALCPFESPYTERLRDIGVEVMIAPMPDDPPWSTIQMAAAIVAAGQVDLLHAHLPKAHLLAGLVGRLTHRPVLATIHGRYLTTLDLEVHRAAASHLSVVCQQTYYQALGLGVSADMLSCDTNGVDTRVFKPRPGRTAGLRERLGLAGPDGDETPLIGFVGRLSPEKGPEVALRAALLWQGRCPQAHLVFVGEGPMERELAAQIAQLGLTGKVHLLGHRDDMPAVYNEFDVLVSSSHSEAMPLALLEAMSCGLPAVATRVGGVADVVQHGQTGWLVAPGDFNDIANCCADLVVDAPRRIAMGQRARERACARFGLDGSVKRVGALMRRLAGRATEATGTAAPAPPPAAVAHPATRRIAGAARNGVSR